MPRPPSIRPQTQLPQRRRSRIGVFLLPRLFLAGLIACPSQARAQDHPPLGETTAGPGQPATVIPLKGRLYIDAGGSLGFPHGGMTTAFAGLLPTVGLHFGMGLRGIPLTLGLGFHQELIANQTWSSSETGVFAYGGNVGFGTLHLSRRLEARHFDVVLRLEPEWRRFRPYLELLGGTSQIFCVSTLSATLGSNLYSQEDTGGLTWSYGYGAGIRFEPFHPMVDSRGSLALVVTVGARRMFAGPLTYLEPRGTVVGGVQSTTISIKEANFDVIEPYLLIGLESRSP